MLFVAVHTLQYTALLAVNGGWNYTSYIWIYVTTLASLGLPGLHAAPQSYHATVIITKIGQLHKFPLPGQRKISLHTRLHYRYSLLAASE